VEPGRGNAGGTSRRRLQRAGVSLGVLVTALVAWSLVWDRTDFLPSPATTFETITELLGEGDTYGDLFATARRLFFGLLIGYVAAVAVALIMQISPWWQRFFFPYVFTTITAPSLAVALLSLMVFGLSEIGVYLAVAIVVFPFVVVSLNEGLAGLDARLSDMSRIYRFSLWQRLRHQALPEMAPFLFSAFRNVHALAWKIVVIAELFSQQNGIGFEYKRAYSFFELDRLIAWTAFFIAMVMFVEYAVLRPLESFVFRWRRAPRPQPAPAA
jgi:NitT/TauT family transport system permease protein